MIEEAIAKAIIGAGSAFIVFILILSIKLLTKAFKKGTIKNALIKVFNSIKENQKSIFVVIIGTIFLIAVYNMCFRYQYSFEHMGSFATSKTGYDVTLYRIDKKNNIIEYKYIKKKPISMKLWERILFEVRY